MAVRAFEGSAERYKTNAGYESAAHENGMFPIATVDDLMNRPSSLEKMPV
ncbi:hypothetical protein [Ralstonia solanacearum]|nr:hypothetical protein [Ralstonia solanacearum]